MNNKPIILIATDNDETNSIPDLKQAIQSIIELRRIRKRFDVIVQLSATVDSMINVLNKNRENIAIIHLAGNRVLYRLFGSDKDEKGYSRLLRPISSLSKLKLVFLDGDSKIGTANDLFKSAVNAVISTSGAPFDKSNTQFSVNFYDHFSRGKGLLNSFELASESINRRASVIRFEEAPSFPQMHGDESVLNWGLFVNDFYNKTLEWNIYDANSDLRKQSVIENKFSLIEYNLDEDSPLNSEIFKLKKEWFQLSKVKVKNEFDTQIIDLKRQLIEKDLDVIINYELSRGVGRLSKDKIVAQKVGKYHAVIIGNNEYEHWSELKGAKIDAINFESILRQKYHIDHYYPLHDVSRGEILDKFDHIAEEINEGDNLIIFFAGHGHWDEDSESGFWLPINAEINRKKNWIHNEIINSYIKEFKLCKHILIISDCCYSGALINTRGDLDIGKSKKEIQVLFKSKSRQLLTSGSKEPVPDNSVFFKQLMSMLKHNDENAISASNLFHTIREKVIANSPLEQKPQMGKIQQSGDDGGDFIFFKKEIH